MRYLIDRIKKSLNSFVAKRFEKVYKKILIQVYDKYISEGRYHIFMDTSLIEAWASKESNAVSKKIHNDSPWGRENCTEKVFKLYTGYWSEKINLMLRNPVENYLLDSEIELSSDFIKLMDDEISTRLLHTNVIVVRWMSYSIFCQCFGVPFNQIKTGSLWTDKAYLSTSLWLYYIGGYDNSGRDLSRQVMLIIEVPKGVTGIYLKEDITNRDEFELILSRGQTLIVKDILYHFQTTAIIICTIR